MISYYCSLHSVSEGWEQLRNVSQTREESASSRGYSGQGALLRSAKLFFSLSVKAAVCEHQVNGYVCARAVGSENISETVWE